MAVALGCEVLVHRAKLDVARLLAGDGCGQTTDLFLLRLLTSLVWFELAVGVAVTFQIWRRPASHIRRLLSPLLTIWFGLTLFWAIMAQTRFDVLSECDTFVLSPQVLTFSLWFMVSNVAFLVQWGIFHRE